MNVMEIMVVVVRFATTLGEALHVLAEMGTYWMVMERIVQVPKQSMHFNYTCIILNRYQ